MNNTDPNKYNISIINEFKKYKDLKFCIADKGGAVIVLNYCDYDKLVSSHLEDTNTYKKLKKNIDEDIHSKIVNLIKSNEPAFTITEVNYFIHHEYHFFHKKQKKLLPMLLPDLHVHFE